jgi:hypothetical protein
MVTDLSGWPLQRPHSYYCHEINIQMSFSRMDAGARFMPKQPANNVKSWDLGHRYRN